MHAIIQASRSVYSGYFAKCTESCEASEMLKTRLRLTRRHILGRLRRSTIVRGSLSVTLLSVIRLWRSKNVRTGRMKFRGGGGGRRVSGGKEGTLRSIYE